jgi:hypothetical protein
VSSTALSTSSSDFSFAGFSCFGLVAI